MEITKSYVTGQPTGDTKVNADAKKTQASATTSTTATKADSNPFGAAAVYEKSDEKDVSLANNKTYKVDQKQVQQMIKESEDKVKSFRKLLESLVRKQAEKNALASGTKPSTELKDLMDKISRGENVTVEVDEATRLEAQEMISEDGYYGVKQTSERILNFAKAISGGDPSKIETLRDAVKKGFAEVEKMFGGELPQISKDTYDAVMKGFDEWENSFKTEGTEV